MPKEKAVKWALGSEEPDDLAEFMDNSDIVRKNKGLPAKGTYTFAVRQIRVKPNKNQDDRLSIMLVMKEGKKDPGAPWNGYMIWDGMNVTEQGAPYIKRFLKALGLEWKDFTDRTKQDDQDPPHITRIGKVRFEVGDDPTVRALVKVKPADEWNDDEHLEIARYIPAGESTDEEDEETDEAVDLSIDSEPDEPEDTLSMESLQAMKVPALRKAAEEAGIKAKKIEGAGKDKQALIDLIVKKLNLPPF